MLVEWLPKSSALGRAVNGHAWTDREFLLAEVADATNRLFELTRAANSDDSKFHPPEPVDRPKSRQQIAQEAVEAEERAKSQAALDLIIAQLLPGR